MTAGTDFIFISSTEYNMGTTECGSSFGGIPFLVGIFGRWMCTYVDTGYRDEGRMEAWLGTDYIQCINRRSLR